jgi:hypothetical protein
MSDATRTDAFESALLNTVVRAVRKAFHGLTLSNCMESDDFRAALSLALYQPLFYNPIEPAMAEARLRLVKRVNHR